MKPTLLPFAFASSLFATSVTGAGLTDDNLVTYVDSLALSSSFDPIKASYWTGFPHHRRTPFALSSTGKTAYLAYLDSSETNVHVQQVDPTTFTATGTPVTVSGGKEAGGLIAHDDGFALLTNEALPSGTANAPAGSTPVPVLYRFDANGNQTWKTFLGGPGVDSSFGLVVSPDINGDLVYSATAGYYAAYIVVTAYSGDASGHYGDAIRYVDASTGKLTSISGASSDWGCSHNTGIAFEAADAVPFASMCAEDQGAIWLNTKGQGMTTTGVKVSNENTTNGGGGESMGGMSGSYSNLARFGDNSSEYVFAWVSRGAVDLTENTWMGNGYTNAQNRTNGRNVAMAIFSDKNTLVGDQATSVVGATDGDSQVNWVTSGTADCSNAHAATFDGTQALITWEEIANPQCNFIAMGCRGAFSGSYFQLVTNEGSGTKVGEPIVSNDVYVAGDMVTMPSGKICWPYVSMTCDLDKTVGDGASGTTTTKMSFACMDLSGSSSSNSSASSTSAAAVASSTLTATVSASVSSAVRSSAALTSSAAAVTSDDLISIYSSNAAIFATAPSVSGFLTASSAATSTARARPSASSARFSHAPSSVLASQATGANTCPPKSTRTVYVEA